PERVLSAVLEPVDLVVHCALGCAPAGGSVRAVPAGGVRDDAAEPDGLAGLPGGLEHGAMADRATEAERPSTWRTITRAPLANAPRAPREAALRQSTSRGTGPPAMSIIAWPTPASCRPMRAWS